MATVAAAAVALSACASTPPVPSRSPGSPASTPPPPSSPAFSSPAPESGPMPPPVKADPRYLPSWMRGFADNPEDMVAKDYATVGMARVESALVEHGLRPLQELPCFPRRVVRQCTVLNAHLADPDGEAVQSFSTPQHPLSRAEGARVNAAIRKACA
ncbi:hypothetical protein [Amycolatopsis orientalis]|uniref:hypothetical protein n=1 Tax=Amycolatopsis orientalis TaxID=31958 RepID=UPI0003AA9325|nr:hypothetical protein [Amycolatopsis orientalis]